MAEQTTEEQLDKAIECIYEMCQKMGCLPMSSAEFWGEELTEKINEVSGYYE